MTSNETYPLALTLYLRQQRRAWYDRDAVRCGALSPGSADGGVCDFQGVQHAGGTVYVPPGWLHGVINLTTTLAVTENVILRQQPPWSQRTSDDI